LYFCTIIAIVTENFNAMKKLLLFLFAIGLASVSFSQGSLALSNDNGPIPNHGNVLIIGDPADEEIVAHIYVTNNSVHPINVMVFRRQNSMASDSSWSQFCWGACFGPDTDTCLFPITIDAGATNTADFSGHYHPKQAIGSGKITYVFYDGSNMADSVAVNVEFKASPAGFSESFIEGIRISEVYPNPANNAAYIDLEIPADAGSASIMVSNLLGSQVKNIEVNNLSGKQKIETVDLKNGLYFCTVKVNGQVISTRRMIVNH